MKNSLESSIALTIPGYKTYINKNENISSWPGSEEMNSAPTCISRVERQSRTSSLRSLLQRLD